jgi:CheY-like chemotaxis protein
MVTSGTQGGHGHSVLLVDDYDDSRVALTYILRKAGFYVVAAWSGEDALRNFREGYRPCVMLLDLRMPGMNGWQVWETMQADPELASIAVVIISSDVDERARAEQSGVREFLAKPVDFDKLITTVEKHCGRQR